MWSPLSPVDSSSPGDLGQRKQPFAQLTLFASSFPTLLSGLVSLPLGSFSLFSQVFVFVFSWAQLEVRAGGLEEMVLGVPSKLASCGYVLSDLLPLHCSHLAFLSCFM